MALGAGQQFVLYLNCRLHQPILPIYNDSGNPYSISTERACQSSIAIQPKEQFSQKLPRGLLTPWVLLVLKQWSLHGYLIIQQLNRMGFSEVDHPTLYKELLRLESRG